MYILENFSVKQERYMHTHANTYTFQENGENTEIII